jgi:hypothetical protein
MPRVEEPFKQNRFGMAKQEIFNNSRQQEKERMLHLFRQVC